MILKNIKQTDKYSSLFTGTVNRMQNLDDNMMLVIIYGGIINIAKLNSKTGGYILCSATKHGDIIKIGEETFLSSKPKICIYSTASNYGKPFLSVISKIPQNILNVIKTQIKC